MADNTTTTKPNPTPNASGEQVKIKTIKEGNLPLLIGLFLIGAILIVSLTVLYFQHIRKIELERVPADDTIELKNVQVTIEELGNFIITGVAINHSDQLRRDVILKFNLVSENNEVITTVTHMVGVRKYLSKEEPETFTIIGEETKKWQKLRFYVESFIPVSTKDAPSTERSTPSL